jgi:dienelactone hydrolase
MRNRLLKLASTFALLSCGLRVSYGESLDAERKSKFIATTVSEAVAWQKASRTQLFQFLKLDDLVEANKGDATEKPGIPFAERILRTDQQEKYTLYELEINSTTARRIRVLLTIPRPSQTKVPAVVCIHGHGGHRDIVYQDESPYRGFARVLAENGYVTISTDVGQHKVYEEGRTLMGERLWDVMRCVDYLTTRREVDTDRIGCAGLSLGGEMAMWLGAMDTRMQVTVSSGFLTTVENMRQGHCPCWDFIGFTENFDFADIYSLTAPRYLQCQNGKLERAPGGFPVSIAEKAMEEIKKCYRVFGKEDRATLVVHPAGHVFDVPSAMKLLDTVLKRR